MRVMNLKPFPYIALMFLLCAFLMTGLTVYAADNVRVTTEPTSANISLTVKEVWLTGDTLHINVLDVNGDGQTLELNLRDYAKLADEYVTVQATDSAGRTSNAVTFKNPYYEAAASQAESAVAVAGENASNGTEPSAATSESAIANDGTKPFTPNGTGSTIDNATSGDGKEFFTVETPDGNVFYLIVDRQRNSENVYLLNAVTEDDLASLAKPGNGKMSESVIPAATVNPTAAPTAAIEPETTAEPALAPAAKNGGNMAMYAVIGIGALAAIGAGYYLKVVRPKKSGAAADYDEAEDFEDGEEHDIPDDDEDDLDDDEDNDEDGDDV